MNFKLSGGQKFLLIYFVFALLVLNAATALGNYKSPYLSIVMATFLISPIVFIISALWFFIVKPEESLTFAAFKGGLAGGFTTFLVEYFVQSNYLELYSEQPLQGFGTFATREMVFWTAAGFLVSALFAILVWRIKNRQKEAKAGAKEEEKKRK